MDIRVDKAAEVWMDDWLLVVTPSSLSIKNSNQNESTQSVDGSPITIPRRDGAQTFTLKFLFPYLLEHYSDPYWVNSESDITKLKDFTDYIWGLKWTPKPFKLTIIYPDETSINGEFILDDYEYTQDAKNGSDYDFSITITESYPPHNYEVNSQLVNSLVEQGIRNPRRLD